MSGTATLLEVATAYWRDLGRGATLSAFCNLWTDEVYGSLGPGMPLHRTHAIRPRSPYSASKATSDHLVRAWHHLRFADADHQLLQ